MNWQKVIAWVIATPFLIVGIPFMLVFFVPLWALETIFNESNGLAKTLWRDLSEQLKG